MTHTAESADKWRVLATKFQTLANGTGGSQLRSISGRNNESQDVVPWRLYDATSEMLREQFKLHAEEAARARGAVRKETNLLNLWLHYLYQYLVYEHSPFEHSPFMRTSVVSSADRDGTTVRVELPAIDKVCEASAAFCLSLQRQARGGELTRMTLAQRFQAWIVGNSSTPDLMYWESTYPMQGWISSVAKCATTPIPIDFLSARLNVRRLPQRPAELRAFFDQVARQEGLMWGITERGLWMAQEPPNDGVYIDSNESQHGEAALELAKPKPVQGTNSNSGPRRDEAKDRFNKFAGPLWKKLRQQRGRKNASIEDLREIMRQLDSHRFLPLAEYLEGTDAVNDLKVYNSKNAHSTKGPIDTWVKLVEHPSFVSAVRRTLARSASRALLN
jgi:hypothetical protein